MIEVFNSPNKKTYTLNSDYLIHLEDWTEEQENLERIKIFNLVSWVPVFNFSCEFCGELNNFNKANLQQGFSYDFSDDRIRILCNSCKE